MKTQFNPLSWLTTALLCFSLVTAFAQESPQVHEIPTVAPAPAAATATTPAVMGPITEITFEEDAFDFGEIEEGTKVMHVFTFTNTGDEVLLLSDAKGSCGCTVPNWPRHPLAPGETGSITVEFNSKNKKGRRSQRVTITANTDPPQTFIMLNGSVVPKPEIDFTIPTTPSLSGEEDLSITAPLENPPMEALDPDCFAIYPNPTAERLLLDMEGSIGESAIITIYSKTGQRMAERNVDQVESTIEFQVGHYPPGIYIANVQVAGKKPESKCFVVVEH